MGIAADVLRLDLIHPIVSGNKWFKLKYHLQQAQKEKCRGIVTFGGAYSNHLVATAWAAKEAGLESVGIIRGEEPKQFSPALKDMQQYNMQLRFVSRNSFAGEMQLMASVREEFPGFFIIPQGGQSEYGVHGAAEITQLVSLQQYSHIACAIGTGTMMAGLVKSSLPHQQVTGISSLKTENTENNTITAFIEKNSSKRNWSICYDYHFGGYARYTPALINFMNVWFDQYQIPTDFVYTAKLFFAIDDLVKQAHFPAGSKILLVHSGGLQGNRSLPPGTLTFR
jgi:1-aminocyclopropane-1-carboxylate deaminase